MPMLCVLPFRLYTIFELKLKVQWITILCKNKQCALERIFFNFLLPKSAEICWFNKYRIQVCRTFWINTFADGRWSGKGANVHFFSGIDFSSNYRLLQIDPKHVCRAWNFLIFDWSDCGTGQSVRRRRESLDRIQFSNLNLPKGILFYWNPHAN